MATKNYGGFGGNPLRPTQKPLLGVPETNPDLIKKTVKKTKKVKTPSSKRAKPVAKKARSNKKKSNQSVSKVRESLYLRTKNKILNSKAVTKWRGFSKTKKALIGGGAAAGVIGAGALYKHYKKRKRGGRPAVSSYQDSYSAPMNEVSYY